MLEGRELRVHEGHNRAVANDFGPDSKIGNDKVIECTGTAKWSLVDPGKYHFHMIIQYPWRNEHTYTARGAYAYNGATL